MAVTARTTFAAVIGSPVRHSRSPVLANAAFRAAGADWVMGAMEVPPGDGARAVDAARTLGFGGLMVTMPHKAEVIPALDRLSPAADALGAVNSIYRDGDDLVGDNTDGAGLIASLAARGVEVAGQSCIVLGAGGAARSIAWALADAGAAEVGILNRTPQRATEAVRLAGTAGRIALPDEIPAARLIINATSVGMGADPEDPAALPIPESLLRDHHIVVDAVYQPLETGLLRAAATVGAQPIDGLGMLVHQAAITIERWIATPVDRAVMERAARSHGTA